MRSSCWKRMEASIITNITIKKSPPPIVGVPALCWWSFEKISDFSPVAVLSRIVFQAFNFLSNLI